MTKKELVQQISDHCKIDKVDVLVTIESFFTNVKESLAKGENIYIRGFGTFLTKKRAAKLGRNIKAQTWVNVPEKYMPVFKPSQQLKDEVEKIQTIDELEERI